MQSIFENYSYFVLPLAAIFVGLGLACVEIGFRWLREKAATHWPVVEGRVFAVMVRGSQDLADRMQYAVIAYSYFVEGEAYESGEYVRSFTAEQDAWDFVMPYQDRKIPVHYLPGKPSVSAVRSEQLERVPAPALEKSVSQ